MRRLSGALRSLLLALCVAAPIVDAQQTCGADGRPPRWYQDARKSIGQSERAAIEAKQASVESLVHNATSVSSPEFAYGDYWSYGDPPPRNQVRSYGYYAASFIRCHRVNVHGADFIVQFNPRPMAWSEGDRPMPDENGDGLFTERSRSETQFGSFATFGVFHQENSEGIFILFAAPGESPTIPVTREEYIKALLFNAEGKNGAGVAEASTVRRKQYEEWLANAAERKQRNEQILAMLAKQDPSKVAKARADMEQAEKGAGEFLKKAADEERATPLSRVTVYGDRLRAQLAAMTPQERASPAWVIGFDFVAPGTPGASAIVRENRNFYRVRQNSSELHTILVHMPNVGPKVSDQHAQLFREFDWETLKRLLVKP